jgi:IS5 family transposase
MIDATIIEAPCSIKNKQKQRDPEAKHTKKGNQYHFGMKAHIGVDADSGIVHSIAITGANVADISMADDLIRDNDDTVLTDAGYQGLEKHEKTKGKAFVLALARVTTRAYGSLAPAICDTRGALLHTGINIHV